MCVDRTKRRTRLSGEWRDDMYLCVGSSPSSNRVKFRSAGSLDSHRASAGLMSAADIDLVLRYCLDKILSDTAQTRPTISLRIYYQVE